MFVQSVSRNVRIEDFYGHPALEAERPPGQLFERGARVLAGQWSERLQGRKKILSTDEAQTAHFLLVL